MSLTLICNGGPYHGKPLTLENPKVGSLVFSVGDQTGRYIQRPIEDAPLYVAYNVAPMEQEYYWEHSK